MNFDKINSYIEGIYEQNAKLTKQEFINKTQLKDFIPVVDNDVARFLKLIIKIVKPKRILEIGTSIGYSTTSMAQMVTELVVSCSELDSALLPIGDGVIMAVKK